VTLLIIFLVLAGRIPQMGSKRPRPTSSSGRRRPHSRNIWMTTAFNRQWRQPATVTPEEPDHKQSVCERTHTNSIRLWSTVNALQNMTSP